MSLTYICPIGELFWVPLLSEFLILFLKISQRFFLDLCLCLFLYFLHFLVFLVFLRRLIHFHFRLNQPYLPQPDSDRLLWVLVLKTRLVIGGDSGAPSSEHYLPFETRSYTSCDKFKMF